MRLIKEPLVQFLFFGAVLFVAYSVGLKKATGDGRRVLVTHERVASLAAAFANAHGRSPSAGELQRQIDDYVREEICCREARAHGFDREDPIIRNELVHQLEAIPDELALQSEPTDAELSAFVLLHPDIFALGRRYTFTQVYLNPEYHPGTLTADALRITAALEHAGASADPAKMADPIDLDAAFRDAASTDLAKQFGEGFLRQLAAAPLGRWCGPVSSTMGQHLVRVAARTEGHLPALADERGFIRAEWLKAQREKSRETFYAGLRSQYTVTIEPEQPAGSREVREAARR